MRQQFEGEGRRDFGNARLAENDLLQERRLHARGTGGAGNRVVNEKFYGGVPVFVTGVFDLRDDLAQQRPIVDGLGVQPLGFTLFDFIQIICVQAHSYLDPLELLAARMPEREITRRSGGNSQYHP